jgi:hypothetical protein
MGRARLFALVVEVTRGKQRKLVLSALGAALVLLLLLAGHPVWAVVLMPLALGPAALRLGGMVGRRLQMRTIAKSDHPLDGLPSARHPTSWSWSSHGA